jgi:hypothetical protein
MKAIEKSLNPASFGLIWRQLKGQDRAQWQYCQSVLGLFGFMSVFAGCVTYQGRVSDNTLQARMYANSAKFCCKIMTM